MAFETFDESVEDAQPQELFLFSNIEETFAYTSGQESFFFDNNTYEPKAISRTSEEIESQQRRRQVVVKLPITDPFVLRYVRTPPASQDDLRIHRLHTTDGPTPEVLLLFDGRVTNVAFTGNEAKINALSRGSVLEQNIPLQTCRNTCNHVLYDLRTCAVPEADFKMNVDVAAVSADGLTVTISGGTNVLPDTGLELSAQLTADPAYFLGGFLTRAGIENRMVLSMTDLGGNLADITLLIPFQTISPSLTIELFAGCDHQFPTCIAKFANTERYGGFPFVPRKNPFAVGVTK